MIRVFIPRCGSFVELAAYLIFQGGLSMLPGEHQPTNGRTA
jgi:hypothetical protein